MKFKVILWSNPAGTEGDIPNASFEFYTKSQAEQACQLWVELSTSYYGWLWDGAQWNVYS